jgi:ABC-type transporter Mla subunit MlaD
LKEQLHQVSAEAKQAAGGLAGFKQRFNQHSAQVQSLIAGTATGVDRDLAEILDAAGKAVEQAAESLEVASAGCKRYADQI